MEIPTTQEASFFSGHRWIAGMLALFVVGLVGVQAMSLVEHSIGGLVERELHGLLKSNIAAIEIWANQQKRVVRTSATDPKVRKMIRELTDLSQLPGTDRNTLIESEVLSRLREHLELECQAFNLIGFVVTNPEGQNIGAFLDEPIGQTALFDRSNFIQRALAGKTLVSRPMTSEVSIPGPAGFWQENVPNLFVSAPVLDDDGTTLAVLSFRIRADSEFYPILQGGITGNSGECYAFDRAGLMISPSRFNNHLKDISLLPDEPEAEATFRIQLRDPGVNLLEKRHPGFRDTTDQPLTWMVQHVINDQHANNIHGYRDYRGVTVIGIGEWIDSMNIGVAMEMDHAEASRPARLVRLAFGTIYGVMILAVGLAVILQHLDVKKSAALVEREELFRSLSDLSPIGIFRTDAEGRYTCVNPCFAQICEDSDDVFNGKIWDQILHPADRAATIVSWQRSLTEHRTFAREMRLARNLADDGRWVSIRLQPNFVNGNLAGYVGTLEDITDRRESDAERERLTEELVEASRDAGRAEVATGVLHNIGNILNSVNVTTLCLMKSLKDSQVKNLDRATSLLREHQDALAEYLTQDEKGKKLPEFLIQVSQFLNDEKDEQCREMQTLIERVDLIKQIVTIQQSHAKATGNFEPTLLSDIVDTAMKLSESSLDRHGVGVTCNFTPLPPFMIERARVLQIIVNLISNAKQAIDMNDNNHRKIEISTESAGSDRARIIVKDNGTGIAPDHLERIFNFGFTTKSDGHGFGLHHSANAAAEMDGSLHAESEGLGKGATFILELPRKPVLKLAA